MGAATEVNQQAPAEPHRLKVWKQTDALDFSSVNNLATIWQH
jgi:hypothetical protein